MRRLPLTHRSGLLNMDVLAAIRVHAHATTAKQTCNQTQLNAHGQQISTRTYELPQTRTGAHQRVHAFVHADTAPLRCAHAPLLPAQPMQQRISPSRCRFHFGRVFLLHTSNAELAHLAPRAKVRVLLAHEARAAIKRGRGGAAHNRARLVELWRRMRE